MNKLIHIAILLLFAASVSAQNQVKSTGLTYSNGIPLWQAVEKTGSEIAIDTVTGFIYQWHRTPGPTYGGGWKRLGQGIDTLTFSTVPNYTPFRNQSWFVVNASNELYRYSGTGTIWDCMNCGLSSTVFADQTISGDGSFGLPLSIAQQSAATGQVLSWTGAAWEPSWGNPYIFITSGATITTAENTVLVGTSIADITIGLPTCNAANDQKTFEIKKNGSDVFGAIIDPSGGELFYDGASTKTIYSPLSLNCTCRFSGGTGVWFYSN